MARKKSLDELMADMAAQGITVSTKLADPSRNTPARRIHEAAQRAGNTYGPDPLAAEDHQIGDQS